MRSGSVLGTRRLKDRGFLLLVVMGLLSLLLVLCVGFLVAVRSQSSAVMHQRDRTDLINLAYAGLDFTVAQISDRVFNHPTNSSGESNVDPSKYVTSSYTGFANALPWYKDLAKGASGLTNWNGGGYPVMSPKRETRWVYLPKDYFQEGGLRARIAVQVVDTNAFLAVNDGLQDGMPSQAQQANMWQTALGWNGIESAKSSKYNTASYARSYPSGTNLYHYHNVWNLASRTSRSLGHPPFAPYIAPTTSPPVPPSTPNAFPDPWKINGLAPNELMQNSIFFNAWGAENCLGQTQRQEYSNYLPNVSCWSSTDLDTGRAALNVNTCFNSGETATGLTQWPGNNKQSDIESVFNVGALRRIIKVGSFHSTKSTNDGVTPGIRYLDPYLYYTEFVGQGDAAKCPFAFDPVTHLVRYENGSGVEVFRNAVTGQPPLGSIPMRNATATPSVLAGANDPATIGTLDPTTFTITAAPGRPALADCPPRDPLTEGTIDPATVTIDPIDSKMSYAITPIGSGGRTYVYKSYDDLYAMLSTEEQSQVEKLKTKLALQYQETLTRYFVASYNNHANPKYPSTNATINSTYLTTYTATIGAGEAGKVTSYAKKFDYTAPRFPFTLDQFRTNVKTDLITMATANNAVYAGWAYTGLRQESIPVIKECGEFVNFDALDRPEIAAGKLDRRTASAIFDNICPGKRLLFPAETNVEIKDPLTQLCKRRVGIDEEAINWMDSSVMWVSKTESASAVNNKRMNNPLDYFMYKEDVNENGVLDTSEDLVKYKKTAPFAAWPTDPDTAGANPNGTAETFEPAWTADQLREFGREVWTANSNSPVKGREYLSTTGSDHFLDENIYFDSASNPIHLADPTQFDQTKPNCLIHPLPQLAAVALPGVSVKEIANPSTIYVKDSNGYWLPTQTTPPNVSVCNYNGSVKRDAVTGNPIVDVSSNTTPMFDTIEYISGSTSLDPAVDLNGDGVINAYYRTPERQLVFGNDWFSRELTTTSIAYRIVVTVELCDAASVDRNAVSPIIVAHSEINAAVQLAPDIEGASVKEAASDYVKADGSADKANDPGLRYYRTNQPTIRKTRTYDVNTGELITYNAMTGVKENYDPVKEVQGLQIRGGTMDENSHKLKNEYSDEHTSCARQWIDPMGVPDSATYRDAFYKNPHQNRRRIVIRDLVNLGSNY